MATTTEVQGRGGLDEHGIRTTGRTFENPTASMLYTHALMRGDARLAEGGPLVVDTGRYSGRSPKAKFVVREPGSEDRIWWGDVNQETSEEHFEGLRKKVAAYLGKQDLFVVDAFAGADPDHRLAVRVITYSPWHALFAKTLFIDPDEDELADFEPAATVLHAPAVEADPEQDGTRSGTFVLLHPTRGEVLIGGTLYAGEIKKSIFTLMNDRLPLDDVFPMHCSANVDDDGHVAVFFGLSGNRQDHALGRPVAAPDRGRRARVERGRRVQPRGRLLREDDPPLAGRRAADLQDDPHVRDDPRERDGGRARRARPRRRLEDREHARRLQARADRQRAARPSARDIRRRSSSSPPTRSGSCRRSRGSTASRRCSTSCPGSPPSSPGRRSASRSRNRPSRPASARRSCRSRPRSTRTCSATSSTSTAPRSGSSTPAGPAGRTARASGCRSRRPAPCCRRRSPGELDDVEYRTDELFGFEVPVAIPGVVSKLLDPRSTWRDPERVRRAGAGARADVPRQLRQVRRRGGRRGRWPAPALS